MHQTAVPSIAVIAELCRSSLVGKRLPEALYVHCSARPGLAQELQTYEAVAQRLAPGSAAAATLIKFSTSKPQISYLVYPAFDTDPHPALQRSFQVNLVTHKVTERDL
ncbi:MAG: hypothetical protein WBA10_09375 [Elainellaceae cyanobacterium]